jgi:geranylgeranyl diphosphate synthase, type II
VDLQAAAQPLPRIEAALKALVASIDAPQNLRDAVAYSLLSGGKRIRPLLTWHCCTMTGGTGEMAIPAAVAVELVHAFSLVHDDLPAMDDDDFRRGRPTLHKATSEAMAILAGDGMLTYAFGHLAASSASTAIAQRLIFELAKGSAGMIAGQVYDTLGGFAPNLDQRTQLELIHRSKTGALLEASCRMGAISAQASDRKLDLVTRYGQIVGLMFQIADDLLDVEGDAQHIGKATGKDAQKGKLTYPGIIGIEASRRELDRLTDEAHSICADLKDSGPLAEIAHYVARRTK